jgi:L-lactate dehydrogenase (cytochrome)
MFHNDAEAAVARAANARGIPYALSAMGTTTIEDFAQRVTGPKAFQIYIFKDRGLTDEFVARCTEAKYDALILTVDTLVAGNRERDRRSGLSIPPRLSLRGAAGFALHPLWALGALTGNKFDFVNVSHRAEIPGGASSLIQYTNSQFDRTLTWRDVEHLAAKWNGPLLIKGVMTAADARRAADVGATGVMISNHGGRQLDGAPAPVDQISEIADAMGGKDFEIICDGGVRRGSDIIKALALGATACSIGRPYLYGLVAGGEAGVSRTLDILCEEFERNMVLAGIGDVASIERRHVRRT